MTPQEKANEFYMNFRLLQVSNDNVDDEIFNSESRAKKCSLIAVNEILHLGGLTSGQIAYWQSVHDELNNL